MITYLNRVHFADGVLDTALAAELTEYGASRPFVVTDAGIVAAGLLDRLTAALPEGAHPTIFSETPSNPTEKAVKQAAHAFTEAGCDSLIGFGGGSAIDLAKAVGLLATHDGPLSQYAAVEGGIPRIHGTMPPLIAIPTTAGTGTEVGRGAIIVLHDGRKLGFISPHLIPEAAICDPTLTLGLPPGLTAGTGMDALTHCVETYIATAYNPTADAIAIDGLRRAGGNLETAVTDGANLDARREMMVAAMHGALAFQKGLGGVHAMSHALGGLPGYALHHGTLNAVLLPFVLAFNERVVGHRYAALNDAMGLAEKADLPAAIEALTGRIGLPTRLSAMGVDEAAIEAAAPLAEKDHTNATNPRKATAADYLALMREAL